MGLTFLRRFRNTFLYRYLPEYTHSVLSSGRCAVSVWGAISKDGLGPLVRIDGRFNTSAYCDVIEQTLLPYVLDGPFPDGVYLLQHDRSPIHTARRVDELLEARGVRLLQWPPNGADLNPIENVWGLMKKRLASRNLGSATADALWEGISQEWETLRGHPETVAALYESMPRRVAQVIDVHGNFSGH